MQPTCSATATSASAIGSYPSKCAGAADSNYVISYTGGTVNVTYSIPALFSETSSKNIGSTVTIKLQLKNYAGMDLSRLGPVKPQRVGAILSSEHPAERLNRRARGAAAQSQTRITAHNEGKCPHKGLG